MNGYSLTVFLFMVPKEKNRQCTCNFFFWGGGGGGGGKQGVLGGRGKGGISFNIMRIADWKIQSQ